MKLVSWPGSSQVGFTRPSINLSTPLRKGRSYLARMKFQLWSDASPHDGVHR